MDLDARPYRAFVGVAEHQSFGRAAEALHITQPALSAQIRELERRLGFSLFSRTSRTVRLTPEGRLFLDKAKRFVLENDWINQAAREIRNTQLRVGAAHFTSLIAERRTVLDAFILAHPNLPTSIAGRSHAQLIGDLANNEIDIAITLEPLGEASSLIEPGIPMELDRFVLSERDVRLLLPGEDGGEPRSSVGPEDLARMRIATVNRTHGVALSEMISRELRRAGAQLVHPPEGDGAAVMHYGALMGIPAVDLGWFEKPAGFVSHGIAGLPMRTALVVLARRQERRTGTELFLESLQRAPR